MVHGGDFYPWRLLQVRRLVVEIRDAIRTTDDVQSVWTKVLILSVLLSFSSHQDAACQILQDYFEVCPTQRDNQELVWSSSREPVDGSRAVELMFHYASNPPANIPWIPLAPGALERPELDPENASFYQLDKWTGTDWIPQTDYQQQENFVAIDESYDLHQWKTSSDPWTHAICARLLCRVPEGQQTPSIAAVEEAFDAVDKLFTTLPRRRNPANTSEEWPHGHVFPTKIYFLLAVHMGNRERAREIIDIAMSPVEYNPTDLFELPATYEILQASDLQTRTRKLIISQEDAAYAQSVLNEASMERRKNGQQEHLHGVEWPELLRRFSEAAFKVQSEEYSEIEEPPQQPSDILLPSITSEKLAEVEAKLGPLPQDIKDMVLIANGFKGGWHFAGGGFVGVDQLWKDPAGEHEPYLGIEPVVERTPMTVTNPDGTTRTVIKNVVSFPGSETGRDWGPVYVGPGAVENDGFCHLICPPDTWKNIKDANVKEGEYRILHYANWTAGPQGEYATMGR